MPNREHLQILKEGKDAWGKWRRWGREDQPDLSDADLRGEDLNFMDLSRTNLSRTNLIGVRLRGANLRSSNLHRANLNDAFLDDANLSEADLNRAHLINAHLASVNLRAAILSGANLRRANLSGSNLNGANLNGANLSVTNLNGAVLCGADLRGADLCAANLRGADLSGAGLSGADLRGVSLRGTGLRGANFDQAIVGNTVFDDIDLREVKGLQGMQHVGPSGVSISTLYRSQGQLPEVFLRGFGVPESFIVQIPSLVAAMQPIQFYSCFISYSSKDQKFAERLHADLQHKGVRSWFAPEDMKIGDKIRVGIDESIRVHDKLLLILSKNSIESEWVEKEVETAMERERQQKRTILFPIRLDDTVLKVESGWAADVRRSRNVGDFRRWKSHDTYSKAFEKLLRDLKASA